MQGSLKKIRIKKSKIKPPSKKISDLVNERNKLKLLGSVFKINEIDKVISDHEANENREKILRNFKFYSENPEQIDRQKMWKLLKNICPKVNQILPTAKRNYKGKLISCPLQLKKLLAKEYKNRLRSRPVRPDLKSMKERKKKIFETK